MRSVKQGLMAAGIESNEKRIREHLDNSLMLLGSFHHLESFVDGVGHWLLAVDVLARRARIHNHALMPVVWDGGNNTINVRAAK